MELRYFSAATAQISLFSVFDVDVHHSRKVKVEEWHGSDARSTRPLEAKSRGSANTCYRPAPTVIPSFPHPTIPSLSHHLAVAITCCNLTSSAIIAKPATGIVRAYPFVRRNARPSQRKVCCAGRRKGGHRTRQPQTHSITTAIRAITIPTSCIDIEARMMRREWIS